MVQRVKRARTPAEATSYRALFLVLAALTCAATCWAVWDEGWGRRPWKSTQQRFNELLAQRGLPKIDEGIRQVTIPTLGVEDRCQTCHLGIDQPGLEDEAVPRELRTHPRREVLLGKHPVDRVGCTPCHAGQGLQTKGVGAAAFAHGRDDPYWEQPLRSKPFIESSCIACHEGEVPDAALFNRGRALFEDRRCNACHSSRHVTVAPPRAPPLDRLKEKTSEAFVVAWLRDPQHDRPGTRMPSFWPEPGPLREREPVAIAAFLGSVSKSEELKSEEGDAAQGEALFNNLGCRGCHALSLPHPRGVEGVPETSNYGPPLDGIGARATKAWLTHWLKNPRALFPQSRMPDLRLSDAEVSDLATFLSSQGTPIDPAWSTPDAALVAEGRTIVLQDGCAACHDIPGVAMSGRHGPDLDDFGDLPTERMEWGEPRPACTFTERECWTLARLQHPAALTRPGIELEMPSFALSDDEALALSVFLLSNREQRALPSRPTEAARAIAAGDRVLERHNCGGCHELGPGRGGQLRAFYEDPALAPPPLTFAGRKFQYRWLFDFLQRPRPVRPWLTARMPTFTFEPGEAEALTRAFAARDGQPFPFDGEPAPEATPAERTDAKWLLEKFQCARCHAVGGNDVKPAERAPDLTLAASRLKPSWMKSWLLDPQALQPGTRMPSYFYLSDDDDPTSWSTPYPNVLGGKATRQVDALVWLTTELSHPGALP